MDKSLSGGDKKKTTKKDLLSNRATCTMRDSVNHRYRNDPYAFALIQHHQMILDNRASAIFVISADAMLTSGNSEELKILSVIKEATSAT